MQHISRFIAPALITVISYFFSPNYTGLHNSLRYDRDAILHGEIWRTLTGNLTHAGLGHWIINIFGLWVLWLMYVENKKRQYQMLLVLFVTSIGTCIGLLLLEPQIKWYVGLSGALHGLIAAGIVLSFKREPRMQLLLTILLCTKLVYEQFSGPLPGSEKMTSVPVIVDSHLYGAITGLIAGFLIQLRDLYSGSDRI